MSFGGSSVGDAATAQYNQQQAAIQTGMQQINNAFSGFTPGFYQQQAQNYENYATPQLNDQARAQQRALAYSLSGQGLTNSSAAKNQQADLQKATAQAQQGIVNQGQQQAQQLQGNVASSEANIIGQLQASANPGAAAQESLAAAANFSAPSPFAPLGNLFSNWGNIFAANSIGAAAANNPTLYNPFASSLLGRSGGVGYTAPTTIG